MMTTEKHSPADCLAGQCFYFELTQKEDFRESDIGLYLFTNANPVR
jgi:hypothetical protein